MIDALGVVLAGGLSRRMEGPEKSLLEISGTTIIERVASRLSGQVDQLIINANGDPQRFGFLNRPVVKDTVEGYAGPLAGVLAAMRWTQENSTASHIITAASDTPFFPADYAHRMTEQAETQNTQITLATSNGRRHPVFGLWSIDLADALEAFLCDEEGRKVMLFVQRYSNGTVDFRGNDPDPFFNINTPDDMKTAEGIVMRQEH